jgi:hypothetical protein
MSKSINAPSLTKWWHTFRVTFRYVPSPRSKEQRMEEIYISPNGDRWRLIRDAASGRMFVRHTPNSNSGGRVTDTDVDAFLATDGPGPEFQALRRLLGEEDDK